MSRLLRFAWAIGLGWSLLCPSLFAQATAGSILGTVHDQSGSPVVGSKVTVTEVNKGTSTTYQTDDAGNHNAPFLTSGTYQVRVEKQGFKQALSANIPLQVDEKARMDFTLQLGEVNQTVEVTAAAPLVHSETSELGEVINEHSV